MYDNVVISIRTSDVDTDDFPIKIGLHHGSALSPYLFALVMDEVTRDIQGDIPWCINAFLNYVGISPKSKGWCITTTVGISLSDKTKVIEPVREPRNTTWTAPAHK